MNADSNLNNPTQGTVAAPDVQPTPDDKFTAYLKAEIDHQKKVDNDARNEPALRMEMCRLIDHLSSVLDDHAHALAHEDGDIGAFNLDIKKDLLTWQLAEFLCRAYLERDPIEPPIVRGWQVDQPHAFDFFRVDVYGDSSLVALEVEANRK